MAEFHTNLWAPWRMEYIEGLDGAGQGCFLCDLREDAVQDVEQHVLWRGERTLTLLNRFPYSNGHILVAPYEHVGTLDELPVETLTEVMCRLRDAQRVLSVAVQAQGFNIGFNIGACAGAGLPAHVHGHIVPRWAGDVNYMAVLADVKVMPQALERTAEAFRQAAAEMGLPA